MGYESKIIIARKLTPDCLDVIAELNMSVTTGEFVDLFDKEWEHGYLSNTHGDLIKTDRYGATLKYATFPRVFRWCLNNEKNVNYARLNILTAILFEVKRNWDTEDIIVIHYGY